MSPKNLKPIRIVANESSNFVRMSTNSFIFVELNLKKVMLQPLSYQKVEINLKWLKLKIQHYMFLFC